MHCVILSRSSDGRYLIVSSIDGFCTIVTLDTELLGDKYIEVSSYPDIKSSETPSQESTDPVDSFKQDPMDVVPECGLAKSDCKLIKADHPPRFPNPTTAFKQDEKPQAIAEPNVWTGQQSANCPMVKDILRLAEKQATDSRTVSGNLGIVDSPGADVNSFLSTISPPESGGEVTTGPSMTPNRTSPEEMELTDSNQITDSNK